jgi:hypothetical protein
MRKPVLWCAIVSIVIAFFGQVLWESPLRVFVFQLTYVGGWIAWQFINPQNAWRFDLVAVSINALLYFAVLESARRLLRRSAPQERKDI